MVVKNLSQVWEQHTVCEFVTRDTEATLATMVDDAYVNHVPVLTGGYGKDALRTFYGRDFIPKMPPDTRLTPVSRTVGDNQLVDEMIFSHPYGRDALDAAGSPTDEQMRRGPAGGDRAISRRQGRT